MSVLDFFKPRRPLSEPSKKAVHEFAFKLLQILQKSDPSKYYTGRGELIGTRYNCDVEHEILRLLYDYHTGE